VLSEEGGRGKSGGYPQGAAEIAKGVRVKGKTSKNGERKGPEPERRPRQLRGERSGGKLSFTKNMMGKRGVSVSGDGLKSILGEQRRGRENTTRAWRRALESPDHGGGKDRVKGMFAERGEGGKRGLESSGKRKKKVNSGLRNGEMMARKGGP